MKRILCLKRTEDLKDNQTLSIYWIKRDIKKARKRYRSRAFFILRINQINTRRFA